MHLRTITHYRNWKNKRVLVRVDFNVPIKNKKVLDVSRIVSAVPTIEYLSQKGAKIILMTHVGRPDGKVAKSLSVDPILKHLEKLLKKKVMKLETGNWKLSEKKKLSLLQKINKMKAGQIAMMENVRFMPGEEENNPDLAKDLARMGDIFVLDGFGVAHRDSVTVTGIAKLLPSYAGKLLMSEVDHLTRLMDKPAKPFVAIMGGIKMATKVPVIKKLSTKTTHILIGGGICNTYLYGKGYYVGSSLVDREYVKETLRACEKKNVCKPVDVIVGDLKGKNYRVVHILNKPHRICKRDEYILDIGPETIRMFSSYIKKAQTLVWNGAMGMFETKPYDVGTRSIAQLVARVSKGNAYGVIGGGETVQAMELTQMSDNVDFISTGGGAMLTFLSGDMLPGLKALII